MSLPNSHWNYPTSIWFGNGKVAELSIACGQLGMKNPLFITDSSLAQLPMVSNNLIRLTSAGMPTVLYANVSSNPNKEQVMEGVSVYHKGQHDGVIAFGGGSGIDAGKTIALMVGQRGDLWDYEDVGDNWTQIDGNAIAPIIAVPTTAGTGSEVGRASVITDEKSQTKKIIFHPKMMPKIVILDPELTVSLPSNLTAWTGLDALTHAIEAYCAPGYHPMADGFAVEAIRLITQYLPQAVENGRNLIARGYMLTAATMAGAAFQKGLGSAHSLAHPLGAIYHQHHGLLNAILLPYALKQNTDVIESRLGYLSKVIAIDNHSSKDFIDFICALRARLNIPHTLADLGIDHSRAKSIGELAYHDPSTVTNAKPVSAIDLQQLFEAAVNGDLSQL
ncbi:MAG: iron-containing alcohol dehydrogenase [Ostreibacterium sp.]